DDERRAITERQGHLRAIEAELREVVVRLRAAALRGRHRLARFPPDFGHLLLGVELPRAKLARPLERRDARVGPDALEIRLAVRGARDGPRLRTRHRGREDEGEAERGCDPHGWP